MELNNVDNVIIPKIESYSEATPVSNFMDTKFKSRTTAPSMILGLSSKSVQAKFT